MLIKNIKQVRQYLPVSATDTDTAVPTMQAVSEQEYLLPVLGQVLLDTLQAEADTVPIPDPLSALMLKTLPAAVLLAYYKEMPFLHTKITSAGIRNITTDTMQGAYRYQYENLVQQCESIGLMYMESLFAFLIANKADYPDWASSTAFARLNKNLIKTGTEFKTYFTIQQPHRTFYALQPIMQEVEDMYIKKTIGADYFAELKDLDAPNDDEKAVQELLRKAIANLTINKSCSKLTVKISVDGFTVTLAPAPDRAGNGENNAPEKQIMQLRQETERDGNNYLNDAKKYLDEHASLTVFANYFSSSKYIDRTAAVTDANDTMQGVFAL